MHYFRGTSVDVKARTASRAPAANAAPQAKAFSMSTIGVNRGI